MRALHYNLHGAGVFDRAWAKRDDAGFLVVPLSTNFFMQGREVKCISYLRSSRTYHTGKSRKLCYRRLPP